jgi:uncharacterized protein YndB with AHSA1/START domain
MSKITYSIEINAPIEKVFDLIDDPEKIKQWMDGLEEISFPEGRNLDNPVGTKFKQKIKEGKRTQEFDGEVMAYEKPKNLSVKVENKYCAMLVDYNLSPIATGTRLDYSCEMFWLAWIARMMAVLFGWVMKSVLRIQMTKLKALAER